MRPKPWAVSFRSLNATDIVDDDNKPICTMTEGCEIDEAMLLADAPMLETKLADCEASLHKCLFDLHNTEESFVKLKRLLREIREAACVMTDGNAVVPTSVLLGYLQEEQAH